VCQDKAVGQPTRRPGSVGALTLFNNDSPFAVVHFKIDRETNTYGYGLGGHAGWHKRGNEETLTTYFEAVEKVLSTLDVLPDQYRVTCPCGADERVEGTYTAVAEYLTQHNKEHGGRISTMTLVQREIAIAQSPRHSEAPQHELAQ